MPSKYFFTVTKSSIDIAGTASMVVPVTTDITSTSTAPDCSTVVDDPTYLAGTQLQMQHQILR